MNRTTTLAGVAAVLVLAAPGQASARGIHYGAVTEPKLLECDRQHWQGLIAESGNCYRALLQSDIANAVRAEAAWALSDLQLANQLFRQALQRHPNDATTRARWGDLYAASHQDGEAMNLYREALTADPSNAFASLGAARLLVGGFNDEADAYLEVLLADSGAADGAQVGAWLLLARVALENENADKAEQALQRAEALVRENDWPPLEIYALRAAADLLQNIADSRWITLSLEYNAHYGAIHATPAHFYVITRRYREAIELYQKAVETEPGLAGAHEELGVNLLRDNQMTRARGHLEKAYSLDPFSPRAVNTLRLMDSFNHFRLIDDPPLPAESAVLPIVLRLHKDEADIIAPYAIRLARDSIAEFTKRYGFELTEPVVIEMYPDHEDFAVRTAGMPGIGILGATFGYVVAMDSPSGRPAEQFQWGTTLWHEMAHVFTLEASNHLVPRWFSEGVSVLEEWRSGPTPGVRIPLSVYGAMQEDRFLPIEQLDEGFLRPAYPEQVIVSYMQAGLVCQFIDRRFGPTKLAEMLQHYRDGERDASVIEAVLRMPVSRFDREFAAYVDAEHGQLLAQFDDWQQTRERMAEQFAATDWQAAMESANTLLEIFPGYVEPDSPYLTLALASDELGERDAAIKALQQFKSRGGYDPAALRRLAEWQREAGRIDEAIAALQLINLVQPLDQDLHGSLGDLLLEVGDAQAALQEYEVALALDPHDKATAYFRVARAYQTLGDVAQSRSNLLLALDIAPNYRPAQRLLLELTRVERGEHFNE